MRPGPLRGRRTRARRPGESRWSRRDEGAIDRATRPSDPAHPVSITRTSRLDRRGGEALHGAGPSPVVRELAGEMQSLLVVRPTSASLGRVQPADARWGFPQIRRQILPLLVCAMPAEMTPYLYVAAHASTCVRHPKWHFSVEERHRAEIK